MRNKVKKRAYTLRDAIPGKKRVFDKVHIVKATAHKIMGKDGYKFIGRVDAHLAFPELWIGKRVRITVEVLKEGE